MARIKDENHILSLIDRHFPREGRGILIGRGDDAALLSLNSQINGGNILLSTDIFREDIHFRRSYFLPQEIGYKALAVNLSDMAGMGAEPAWFALNLLFIPDLSESFLNELLAGMAELAQAYNLPLIGGDISKSDKLSLDITILGRPGKHILRRGKAQVGDVLFILGEIGLAKAGWRILEKEGRQALDNWPKCVQAHLRPRPLVEAGKRLTNLENESEEPIVRGLMDISDGLGADLPRFLPENLGAELILTSKELHPELLSLAKYLQTDPLITALSGGEDYALLGCASHENFKLLIETEDKIRVIGQVSPKKGLYLNGYPLNITGFDHFKIP